MMSAKEYLIEYAKGKPIEMLISDGGGNLPNNTRHIADAMEAYADFLKLYITNSAKRCNSINNTSNKHN